MGHMEAAGLPEPDDAYERPEIVVLGRLEEVTQGVEGEGVDLPLTAALSIPTGL